MSTNQVNRILPLAIRLCDKNRLDIWIHCQILINVGNKNVPFEALGKKIEFYDRKTWLFGIALVKLDS